MGKTVKEYLDCESKLEQQKDFWKNQWQLVSEYVHQRRADFTATREAGAFISSQLWSDDAVHMAETSASAFLGYVWSAGVKSFKLAGNEDLFEKDRGMSEFWQMATKKLQSEMDDQEAGLSVALDETMLDLIVLGTDAVLTEERNVDKPQLGCLQFEGWSVLEFSLDENGVRRADKFYRRRQYTVRQCVEKYTLEKVSKKTREAYEKHRKYDEIVNILHVIEPRLEKHRKKNSKAAKDMPYASVHIEVDNKHIARDSGYPELPVACARLAKRLKEKYGRGRAMNALPSIMMLNQIMEDLMLAEEKKLDPPMYVLNNAIASNGTLDSSAGSLNVLRIDKAMPNMPPAGKLFDIQDTRQAAELIEMLKNNISNHFMIDRLINLNNDVEMTKGEAFLRNAIRQSTLRSIVSRLLAEKFEIIIQTSFNICLRRNKFGYVPGDPVAARMERSGRKVKYLPQKFLDAIATGENLYNIEYLTPAARDLLAEEGQGMIDTLGVAGEMASFDETIPDRIDSTWTLNRLGEIRGVNPKMFKTEAQVNKALAARQEQNETVQDVEVGAAAAKLAKDAATAQNVARQ